MVILLLSGLSPGNLTRTVFSPDLISPSSVLSLSSQSNHFLLFPPLVSSTIFTVIYIHPETSLIVLILWTIRSCKLVISWIGQKSRFEENRHDRIVFFYYFLTSLLFIYFKTREGSAQETMVITRCWRTSELQLRGDSSTHVILKFRFFLLENVTEKEHLRDSRSSPQSIGNWRSELHQLLELDSVSLYLGWGVGEGDASYRQMFSTWLDVMWRDRNLSAKQ